MDKFLAGVFATIVVVGLYALQVFCLRFMWNELAPLFHAPSITAWQSMLMLGIAACLFGAPSPASSSKS